MSDHYAPAQGDDSAAKWLIGATDPEQEFESDVSANADIAASFGRAIPEPRQSEDDPVGNSYRADWVAGTSTRSRPRLGCGKRSWSKDPRLDEDRGPRWSPVHPEGSILTAEQIDAATTRPSIFVPHRHRIAENSPPTSTADRTHSCRAHPSRLADSHGGQR